MADVKNALAPDMKGFWDQQLEVRKLMEPGALSIDERHSQASIAISLKRIADSLEKIASIDAETIDIRRST